MGFVTFPFFTYPLFLEVSDFTGLSDYVFYDFNNNPLAVKILFLRQPEKPYNQAAWVFVFLVFHRSFIWVVVFLIFSCFQYAVNRIVKGRVLHSILPYFTMRFAVFWNVVILCLSNYLIFNKIRSANFHCQSSCFS